MRLTTTPISGVLVLLFACTRGPPPALDGPGTIPLRQGIRELAEQIPSDLARDGPRGWLRHFERGPGFFMASDGRLVFASYRDADSAVADLAKRIRDIDLRWGLLRIDSLTPDLATLATPFTEDLTDTTGQNLHMEGFFTALAVRADSGWQLRNLHWSLTTMEAEH